MGNGTEWENYRSDRVIDGWIEATPVAVPNNGMTFPCPHQGPGSWMDEVTGVGDWAVGREAAKASAIKKLVEKLGAKCDTECSRQPGLVCPDPTLSWKDKDVSEEYTTRVEGSSVKKRCVMKTRGRGIFELGQLIGLDNPSLPSLIHVSCECKSPRGK